MAAIVPVVLLFLLPFSSVADIHHIPLHLTPDVPSQLHSSPSQGWEHKRSDFSGIRQLSSDMFGTVGQGYCSELLIGTPPQKLRVLLDTGSSNLAFAGRPFDEISNYFDVEKSSTAKSYLGSWLSVAYVQGRWRGYVIRDLVGFNSSASLMVWTRFVAIMESQRFFIKDSPWEGIMGLAYDYLSKLHEETSTPFFDDYHKQFGLRNIFSMLLCGTTQSLAYRHEVNKATRPKLNGLLILGGVNETLYTGPMYYIPIRERWYYEVVLTNITVNGEAVINDCKELNVRKTIVDSGTTEIHLPWRAYLNLVAYLKAHTSTFTRISISERFWTGASIVCVPAFSGNEFTFNGMPYAHFPDIHFSFMLTDKTVLEVALSPQQYLRYVGVTSNIYPSQDCFKFAIVKGKEDTVLGATFMEGFYTVFDRQQHRLGLAQSTCNRYGPSFLNISRVIGVQPYVSQPGAARADDCAYRRFQPRRWSQLLHVSMIILLIICLIIFFSVLIFACLSLPFENDCFHLCDPNKRSPETPGERTNLSETKQ